ncbi:DUF2057 domain-containing protein [Seongchinamella unica]|uniref:DUF2057 domain-containing protein n=1 Tax=Seongchinamella unica TaxID=2547392 RepID=A0A4R5LP24_9GAMM|nr:DUF2057 domain-containing protein [Seongchinamella unica]TDG12137.1 DUF2057 domain-containing protein [Seongchinamella unica]
MKTSVSAAVAIGAALTSSPLSAASLTIPMAFEFIALNGQMIERSLVMRKDELQFAPGHHEIALRYSDMIESDFNDTPESIRSAAFIITLDASDDGDYVLVPAGGEVIRNPREFAAAPEVVITDEDGAAAKFTLTRTDVTRDFAASLYGNETRVGSDESPPAPAPSASADVVENVFGKAPAAAPLPIDTAGASPADMLQLWWRRADEKTRKEFLGWAIDQL